LDVRFPPGLNSKLIQESLEGVIQRFSNEDPDLVATVHLDPEFQMPPYEANLDDPIVRVIREASKEIRGVEPPVGPLAPWKFMGADCGHMHAAGIPGVMLGVGTFTSSVPDEYIELSKAVDLAKIYALTFYRMTGEPKGKLN
jgi:acetylornithine deacetylase/succinyl-diaminopimelate desuccinylase-like protein